MDPEKLVAKVTVDVLAEIAKATTPRVIDWLKRRCGLETTKAIDALVADPRNCEAKMGFEMSLRNELEKSSRIRRELSGLVGELGDHYGRMAATAGGGTIAQVQGKNNSVSIGTK